jgi:hypothetical protein
MLALITWCLGMLLEALVLMRGVKAKLIPRFPLFYSYLLVVVLQTLICPAVHYWYQDLYPNVYWTLQFVCLFMGSLLVFEIYKLALREFPGTARMARMLLQAAFVGVLLKALLTMHANLAVWLDGAYVIFERDLRMVQLLAFFILVIVFLWYAIPFGRNLGGIFLGYSIFVALSVMQLSLVAHFWHKAEPFWAIAQPITYTAVLVIWTAALWSADPVTKREAKPKADSDYDSLAGRTAASLKEARGQLDTVVRP